MSLVHFGSDDVNFCEIQTSSGQCVMGTPETPFTLPCDRVMMMMTTTATIYVTKTTNDVTTDKTTTTT